jgi:hypothetical protein
MNSLFQATKYLILSNCIEKVFNTIHLNFNVTKKISENSFFKQIIVRYKNDRNVITYLYDCKILEIYEENYSGFVSIEYKKWRETYDDDDDDDGRLLTAAGEKGISTLHINQLELIS